MRREQSDWTLVAVAFTLTLGILISFQVYILREPARIEHVLAEDNELAYEEGQALFAEACVLCHGENGEGNIGPALNDPELLSSARDNTFFSLISSGVPGTAMPAWNQAHGGPFTDEQIRQLVVYIRAWELQEETEPEAIPQEVVSGSDPINGETIFIQKCAACHGADGEGGIGVTLNNPSNLAAFDDAWYAEVIAVGRPSKGMPTWGTVLSPQEISDVIAYIRQWEK